VNARAQVLITAAELASMVRVGELVAILDVRWRLDEPDGRARTCGVISRARCMCRFRRSSAITRSPAADATLCRRGATWGLPHAVGGSERVCRSLCMTIGIERGRHGRGGC
jgi:hypothetical protein